MPEQDVRLFKRLDQKVYGILAAPPCDHFSVSGAQYWKAKDADGRTLTALSIADACLRIIKAHNPEWWCLENPVGRLRHWIGAPVMMCNPCDYAGHLPSWICRCGNEFEEGLGKYGCCDCLGEPPAQLAFKDAYTKKTLLWGKFNPPKKLWVEPIRSCKQGSWLQKLGGKSEKTKRLRSVTPPAFAKAFFFANP